jgi:sterol 3beta-glucosyltransferase
LRIAIASLGSRGDVQPMAALAAGLARRGHAVSLIAPLGYESLVHETGVELRAIDYDVRAVLASPDGRRLLRSGHNIVAGLRAMRAIGRRYTHALWQALAERTQDCELLIGDITSWVTLAAIAEQRGLLCIQASLQPRAPTAAFPHPFALPPRRKRPGWANRLQHHLIEQLLWQTMRPLINRERRDSFGLPGWPFFGPHAQLLRRAGQPTLMAYSHHLLPRPADWLPEIDVTGYWFLDRPAKWRPPTDLVAFLDAGPPPIYVGFGSMTLPDPEAMARLVLAAIAQAGCRAVLAAGWGGLRSTARPADVFVIDETPHDWLFPRMAAVIHHGGAGTTAAALRAGVPSVIVPFMGDQFFWAHVLALKGVAPPALPQAKLSAPIMARAIVAAVSDPALRARAAALGALIKDEDGIGRAAARIEAIAAARSLPTGHGRRPREGR